MHERFVLERSPNVQASKAVFPRYLHPLQIMDDVEANAGEKDDIEVEEDNDTTSSDDGMDDDEVDDEKASHEIESVQEKLSAYPYNYQLHIELVTLLRKAGELEKLRHAREDMAKIFPLTEHLWLQWIEDEKKLAETEEDHKRLVELFERAVNDYLSPDVWLEYVQYAIRWLDMEDGMNKIRNLMERALTAVGLHVTKGSSIWETYREFENAIVMTLQPTPGSVPTSQQQELLKKQLGRVESLFMRQLAIPLLGMDDTLGEYKEWSDKDIDVNVKRSFQNAMKQLEELMPFEQALSDGKAPNLEAYQEYIQCETKSADPARIQCVYERALADNCLSPELWSQYIKYLTHLFKRGDVVIGAHLRSVRNCPWVGHLWVQYLLALERSGSPKEKLDEVFDEAIHSAFSSAFEYVELWRTKCEQTRRRLSACPGREEIGQDLRDCFSKAIQDITERLLPAYDDTGDPNYTMWCFWARCEAGCLDNKAKAVEVLQSLLRDEADARRKVCIYREYYNIERLYGGDDKTDQCRSVLRQAVQNCAILPDAEHGGMPDAEVACCMLLDFERDHGTLEDMDESIRRVLNKMTKVTRRREKAMEHHSQSFKNKDKTQKNKGKGPPRKRKLSDDAPGTSKQGQHGGRHEQPKRAKESPDDGFKAPAGVPPRSKGVAQGKELPKAGSSGPPPGFKPPKGPPPGFKKPEAKRPPPGYKGPPGQSDLNNNGGNNDEKMETNAEDKTAHIASSTADMEKTADEKNTIFVSNLDFQLEDVEEKLRTVFCDCGSIADVRLAKNNKGQFRGFGYIQFTDEGSVKKALELDRQDLSGRPMFVSPNVDKKKQPNFKVFKYGLGLEKHKLFVSNLSFSTTEETIHNEFSQLGAVKSARVVTNRKGNSKGLAYVEYENEADAAQAVMKMDGKEIDGFAIRVAISNPPSRKPTGADVSASLGGGGGRDQFKGSRGRGRTQLSMLPRTLQRAADNDSKPSGSKSGMTNKDFAALLLKK